MPPVESDSEKAALAAAEDLAVDILWRLSGRQFGVCPVIVRPCPQSCAPDMTGSSWWTPVLDGGLWRNIPCGCIGDCRRSGPAIVHLPGPVQGVVAVAFNGTIQPVEAFALEGDYLYRAGGESWPDQDLQSPDGSNGTWSVEYWRGTPVPDGVGVLVGKLALEFYQACAGGKCRLPRRVRSVTRNGLSFDMVDPTDILASGKTGLPEVDLFLAATNPHQVMRRPRVR